MGHRNALLGEHIEEYFLIACDPGSSIRVGHHNEV